MTPEKAAKSAAENTTKELVKQTRESYWADAAKSAAVGAALRHLSHDVDVCQSEAPLSELFECVCGFYSDNMIPVIGTEMIVGVCSVRYDKYIKKS